MLRLLSPIKKWFRSVIRHLIRGSALATAELMTPPMRSCAWAISWRRKRVQPSGHKWLSGSEIKTCRAWVGLSSFLGLSRDARNQCNLIVWCASIISMPHRLYQIKVLLKKQLCTAGASPKAICRLGKMFSETIWDAEKILIHEP